MEELKKQTIVLEEKFGEQKIMKLKKLIEWSDQQNEEIVQIIEVYKEMVSYINDKIISQRKWFDKLFLNHSLIFIHFHII